MCYIVLQSSLHGSIMIVVYSMVLKTNWLTFEI